jgi:putative ABC transport system permease protein
MRDSEPTITIGPAGQQAQPGRLRSVDPDYFEIMHLRLRAGRLFMAQDTEPVAVVSESYGRQFFGNDSPVGRTLRSDDRDVRIVGVVSDIRYADPSRAAFPALYRPFSQEPTWRFSLLVEPEPGMEAPVVAGIRTGVRAIDPTQPVGGLTTIDQLVSESTAERRLYAVSTGAFAAVALALAIAGVFGVVARTVSERRREIAIRVALGAEPRRMVRLVYGYGLLPAAAGTLAGLSLALASSRLLRGFLFEIAPNDFVTFAAAASIVLAVTAAACYLPARRTLQVQPMAILTSE